MFKPKEYALVMCLAALFASSQVAANTDKKPATTFTAAEQQKVLNTLPFTDDKDFELSEKGLIKRPKQLTIKDDAGNTVWELGNYSFLTDGRYEVRP